MNPLEQEAAALDALDAWAERTGRDTEDKEYKSRLKHIQNICQGQLAAAAAAARGNAPKPPKSKVEFNPIEKWALVGTAKHKDKSAAKALLKKVQGAGEWKQDIACPRSSGKGGLTVFRFVNVTAVGGPYLARITDMKNGSWSVETPIFKEVEEEEEEDDKDDDDDQETQQGGDDGNPPPPPPAPAAGKKSGRSAKRARR